MSSPTEASEATGRRWLNRNVLAIGLADLMADFNYETVMAILPLFLTMGLGAPVFAVGLVEGVGDGSAALVKVWSGWFSDRVAWRRRLATAGYGATVAGFASLVLVYTWPPVVLARAFAWMGRGLRQPIRSALLAGSVERRDLGKAFGLHQAMDTFGALIGPAVAFLLLAGGHDFRTVLVAAVVPGVLAVVLFGLLTRDPRPAPGPGRPLWQPLPGGYWRCLGAVAIFGAGNFATAFFTLRAAELLRPGLGATAAASGAVLFFLASNAVGSVAAFPAGWLADRVGRGPVLAFGYAVFAVACLVAAAGHGPGGVALMAIPVGVYQPIVKAMEGSLAGGLVPAGVTGTAFGLLDGVNGVGDLVSSLVTGLLWSLFGAPAGLAFGGLLGLAGSVALLLLRPERGMHRELPAAG